MQGKTVPVPIGIDTDRFSEDEEVCMTYDRTISPSFCRRERRDSHKGNYGKVLMITGSSGMAGAACLSAKAAYTAGAGLVRIYTAEENRNVLQQLLPEAIISCYGRYNESELSGLLNWADIVCIGCGLGMSDTSEQILEAVLRQVRVPCIIDADGLNLLSRHIDLLDRIQAPAILTPHMKEMSRLTGYTVSEISERMEIIEDFTEKYPVVCVMKDSRTIVKDGADISLLILRATVPWQKPEPETCSPE